MATACKIILSITVLSILHENAECTTDPRRFFLRSKRSRQNSERRASASTEKDKETNKLVLAALYGGLGMGVPSIQNLDYAKGLDSQIQAAGGYGLPPGLYSYAFDPATGMPFMCDPTKTSPGGLTPQTSAAATNSPVAAAKKPASDLTSNNALPAVQPSVNTGSQLSPSTNAYEGVTKTPSDKNTPSKEHRLSPITHIKNDAPPISENSTTTHRGSNETTPNEELEDIRTSPSPSNQHDGVTPNPEQTTTESGQKQTTTVSDQEPPNSAPTQQSVGDVAYADVNHDIANHVQTSHVKAPEGHMVGTPLFVSKPQENSKPQSSAQNKISEQRLKPLIENLQHDGKSQAAKQKGKNIREISPGVKQGRTQSNGLKNYIQRKSGINIKLPEIPPCPDMKDYHWPWNCLEKGKAARKQCIEKAYASGTYFYNGDIYPYENYEQPVFY